MKYWFAVPLLMVCASANAAEFTRLRADQSFVHFVSKQMGVPVDGAFKTFAADISLDPARPEAGRARVDIDLASIDTGSEEANDEVKGGNWFDVRRFPRAVFVSSSVKPLGGGRFEVAGKMTVKGKTLDLRAPFTLREAGGTLVLDGAFPLKRLDYAIGTGSWSDTSVVEDEVRVTFHFVLTLSNSKGEH